MAIGLKTLYGFTVTVAAVSVPLELIDVAIGVRPGTWMATRK
jgi:hypothetical protein